MLAEKVREFEQKEKKKNGKLVTFLIFFFRPLIYYISIVVSVEKRRNVIMLYFLDCTDRKNTTNISRVFCDNKGLFILFIFYYILLKKFFFFDFINIIFCVIFFIRERATFPAFTKEVASDNSRLSSIMEDEEYTPSTPQKTPSKSLKSPNFETEFAKFLSHHDRSGLKSSKHKASTPEKSRQQEEADAALALLKMQAAAAEKERKEKLKALAQVVYTDHCYLYKGEAKKRFHDCLPYVPKEGDSDQTDSASEGEPDMIPCLPSKVAHDHQYCAIYHPIDYAEQYRKMRVKALGSKFKVEDYFAPVEKVEISEIGYEVEVSTEEVYKKFVNRTKTRKGITDVTNLKGSRELMSLLPSIVKSKPKFKSRTYQEQMQCTFEFLVKGMDAEDVVYLKRRYEELLQDDSPSTAWLNNVHWVDHTHTLIPDPPPAKRRRKEDELRKHVSGKFEVVVWQKEWGVFCDIFCQILSFVKIEI